MDCTFTYSDIFPIWFLLPVAPPSRQEAFCWSARVGSTLSPLLLADFNIYAATVLCRLVCLTMPSFEQCVLLRIMIPNDSCWCLPDYYGLDLGLEVNVPVVVLLTVFPVPSSFCRCSRVVLAHYLEIRPYQVTYFGI